MNNDNKRSIRSFMRRQGRVSLRQSQGLEKYWPQYGLATHQGMLDYLTLFGRPAETIMEIGFGMGQSLVRCAQENPSVNYIGVEVHRPGIGSLLAQMAEDNVTNIRVFQADVQEVLVQNIPDESLSGIQIFFPDPWPKRRHLKRRLIQTDFVELLWHKLKIGGFVHLATDWEQYARHMMQVFSDHSGFNNMAGHGHYLSSHQHQRPLTKFESRGQKLGHGVWDLMFIKVPR